MVMAVSIFTVLFCASDPFICRVLPPRQRSPNQTKQHRHCSRLLQLLGVAIWRIHMKLSITYTAYTFNTDRYFASCPNHDNKDWIFISHL